MKKTGKRMGNTSKKKPIKAFWDYFAAIAFILAGSYYLATERASTGAIYILVGLFFFVITRSRDTKKK
ncbi:hypothetical protein [Desulfosporosinus youngiae]|uniref:Uncharacterized protein n=1 Tax=Desulfosporosinus youngiae DSM 17734 TaxID=768710 RepID=H5Y5D0_9FIRM|nr:hypothetical protein [Desulfosporosinus youngiae]EHQ90380.1 hypothetical protein DesyoDRAFT_3354 [Desulfosporosinus youngiae DSM 17734]